MLRKIATEIKDELDAKSERGLVHYDAPFLLGWASLCGHVDRTDYRWIDTTKRANCPGCLAVADHVRGRMRKAQKRTGGVDMRQMREPVVRATGED